MTSRLIVVGAGGFGRETLDVIAAVADSTRSALDVAVVDDSPRAEDLDKLERRQTPYLGAIAAWTDAARENDRYVIAIGDPTIRASISERIGQSLRPADALIHPSANLGSLVTLGPGTVVCAGAALSTSVRAGSHTHINPGAIIGHDAQLGDFVSVNPGAIISGNSHIGHRSLVGAGAVILQQLRIGNDVVVGAGACVTREVAARRTVKGVPAR